MANIKNTCEFKAEAGMPPLIFINSKRGGIKANKGIEVYQITYLLAVK